MDLAVTVLDNTDPGSCGKQLKLQIDSRQKWKRNTNSQLLETRGGGGMNIDTITFEDHEKQL